jgi:spore coat polysaccharide biosynthesis protein SpsF
MKRVCIIQARLGSSRLPGKVLLDIGGKSMLARVVRRSARANIDQIVIATTTKPSDEPLIDKARSLGAEVFLGPEDDVLSRYYLAAVEFKADVVLRVTSDCPLIDPDVINKNLMAFDNHKADYATNTITRTYPRGLDVEVFSFDALQRAWKGADQYYQRAGVNEYVHENPSLFKIASVENDSDESWARWTVDEPSDLEFIRKIYEKFGNDDRMPWLDILEMLRKHPELRAINAHVRQKIRDEETKP